VKDTGEIWSEFAPPYAGVDDANLLRFLELSGLLVVKDGGRGSRRVEEGTDGFVAQLIDAMEP
jgi:hypothetical protein